MNRQKDVKELQLIMHQHGLSDFLSLLIEAAKNAAEDTEDLPAPISENWENFWMNLELITEKQVQ